MLSHAEFLLIIQFPLALAGAEVCVETTSVVDTHELLMAGRRDDARGHDHVLRT